MIWVTEQVLTAIGEHDPGMCVTDATIALLTGFSARQLEGPLLKLRKRELLTQTARGCYRLTSAGRAALAAGSTIRSGPQGAWTGKRIVRESLRARVWARLRLRAPEKLSIPDIARAVRQGDERDIASNIRKYLQELTRAGYLARLDKRERGTAPTSNGYHRYMLVRDTGPQAPVWRPTTRTVWDPNTEEETKA